MCIVFSTILKRLQISTEIITNKYNARLRSVYKLFRSRYSLSRIDKSVKTFARYKIMKMVCPKSWSALTITGLYNIVYFLFLLSHRYDRRSRRGFVSPARLKRVPVGNIRDELTWNGTQVMDASRPAMFPFTRKSLCYWLCGLLAAVAVVVQPAHASK